jgi:hypothetical protein
MHTDHTPPGASAHAHVHCVHHNARLAPAECCPGCQRATPTRCHLRNKTAAMAPPVSSMRCRPGSCPLLPAAAHRSARCPEHPVPGAGRVAHCSCLCVCGCASPAVPVGAQHRRLDPRPPQGAGRVCVRQRAQAPCSGGSTCTHACMSVTLPGSGAVTNNCCAGHSAIGLVHAAQLSPPLMSGGSDHSQWNSAQSTG